jgi:TusA-related sulfurtransferase
MISNNTRQQLKERIEKMTKMEQTEVLKIIIKNNGRKYSENINGSFINMNTLTDETIDKLNDFIDFCDKNNNELNEQEEYIKEFKEFKDITTKK